MTDTPKTPTAAEFAATVREAFSFLQRFGFQEVAAPDHRSSDSFRFWFSAGDRSVVVAGEGWGTMASVTLEQGGLELPEIFLVPSDERPARKKKTRPDQLEQIREAARRLERFATDFLEGDLSRFAARARPLPPYKQPPVTK